VGESAIEAPFPLDRFELVFLKRPASVPAISDEEAERLQERHLAYLGAMTEAGNIRLAGPFDGQNDQSLRGLCLYRTGSLERATELASADPAVAAGQLEVDVMYFYCPSGSL
jgi:uncharacterized protein YciI